MYQEPAAGLAHTASTGIHRRTDEIGPAPARAAQLRDVQRRARGPLPPAPAVAELVADPGPQLPSPSERALGHGVQRRTSARQQQADQASAPAAQPAPAAAAPSGGGAQVVAQAGSGAPELSYAGPLGPYGPLGMLGPVGDNSWNPSQYISGAGSSGWSGLQKELTQMGGPLSEQGPLGPGGPLAQAHNGAVPASMQPGGKEAALGPEGPLGALGPLGPLGPIGAHGYKADANGNYRDAHGNIVKDVQVPYQGGTRDYELVEDYKQSYAEKAKDLDTSFMVEGAVEDSARADTYTFTAHSAEYVTVLLTPEKQLDTFELVVTDENNKVLADNKAGSQVDWVQLRVPAGTRLKAKVKLLEHMHLLSPSYRLIVTGSGPYAKE